VSYAIRFRLEKQKFLKTEFFSLLRKLAAMRNLAIFQRMNGGLAFFFSAAVLATAFAQEAPTTDNIDSFDIEPPLLVPNRGDEPLPDVAAPESAGNLAQLEKNLERAKRIAAGAERLYRIGVLSNVEAEQRALRVVRLEFDLEDARLAQAKEELAVKQKQLAAGEIAKEELAQAEASLARTMELAGAARVKRDRAEIQAAEVNLHRQEKLLVLGSGRKSDVARAQQKLAELKAPRN
jgi:hypothetical protein